MSALNQGRLGSAAAASLAVRTRAGGSARAALTRANGVAALLGGALVTVPGFDSGGYSPGSWSWPTLALACLIAARLVLAEAPPIGGATVLLLAVLAALGLWMLSSGTWGIAGSGADVEARRALLYLTAFAALVVCVEAAAAPALLGGVLLGILALVCDALVGRLANPHPQPIPFEGTRLVGSLGYANALGLLAAMALLLVLGLAAGGAPPWLRRPLLAATVPLAVTVALTESRGGWVALAAGLVAMIAVCGRGRRFELTSVLVVTVPVAAGASAASERLSGGGLAAVILGGMLLLLVLPALRVRWAGVVAAILLIATVVAAIPFVHVSFSSSNRARYWRIAVHDVAQHPLLGSGAGSYRIVAARAPEPAGARNAHNLYLESLAELGPLGLALVGSLALVPLAAGVRARKLPLVPAALAGYTAFVVHAGFDWDWQIPVIPLSALCLAAILVAPSAPPPWLHRRALRALGIAAALALMALALMVLVETAAR